MSSASPTGQALNKGEISSPPAVAGSPCNSPGGAGATPPRSGKTVPLDRSRARPAAARKEGRPTPSWQHSHACHVVMSCGVLYHNLPLCRLSDNWTLGRLHCALGIVYWAGPAGRGRGRGYTGRVGTEEPGGKGEPGDEFPLLLLCYEQKDPRDRWPQRLDVCRTLLAEKSSPGGEGGTLVMDIYILLKNTFLFKRV